MYGEGFQTPIREYVTIHTFAFSSSLIPDVPKAMSFVVSRLSPDAISPERPIE